MAAKRELQQIGFKVLGGATGILLVGLLMHGDVGLVLRYAGLLGLPTSLCILALGELAGR
jgi:hypothetical protein